MKIGILGAGITGYESAINLRRSGFEVLLSEIRKANDLDANKYEKMIKAGVIMELGKNSAEFFKDCDRIILSPGISLKSSIVESLKKQNKKIISDIDMTYEIKNDIPYLGVTGTNGKTTATTLLGKLMALKYRAFIGGNIGNSLTNALFEDPEYIVCEISSYQLDISDHVRFRNSFIINISDDHLNRYDDMNAYIRSKMRLAEMTTSTVIINIDDVNIKDHIKMDPSRIMGISIRTERDKGAFLKDNELIFSFDGEKYFLKTDKIKLMGQHNLYNIMGSVLIALINGVNFDMIENEVNEFQGLPLRIQYVGEINGVRIYNDGKSTTPHSTIAAIETFPSNVILLIGGSDEKGSDFSILKGSIQRSCKKVLTFGEAGQRIKELINGENTEGVYTIAEALDRAISICRKGDVILFSPACSSFDQFSNYKERGEYFNGLVNERT